MDNSSTSFDSRLGPILDQILVAARDGDLTVLDDKCSEFPDLANQIRSQFQTIMALEGIAGASSPAEIVMPDQLDEYQLREEIGRGGMGVVYRAYQPKLDRWVALKLLPATSVSNREDLLERFQLEARAVARLRHPHIVGVYDTGQHQDGHYLVMQLIEGVPLAKFIRQFRETGIPTSQLEIVSGIAKLSGPIRERAATSSEGRKSNSSTGASSRWSRFALTQDRSEDRFDYFQWSAYVISRIAFALDYAHRQGVVHRDIKPSNILLDQSGHAWLADFGLAKIDESELTRTGDVVGTLRYLAPERMSGWSDPRSDVFSLGLTLYELVTLHPAYECSDAAGLMKSAQLAEVKSPRKVSHGVPVDLDTIILKAVAAEPEHRYRSAGEFALDLERFLDGEPIAARKFTTWGRLLRWCRRQPVVAGLAALSILLVVSIASVSTWSALKLGERLRDVQQANELADRRLLDSYWSQLEALTSNEIQGNRTKAIRTLKQALPLIKRIEPEQKVRWRNAAIVALSMMDARVAKSYTKKSSFGTYTSLGFDANVRKMARLNGRQQLELFDLDTGQRKIIKQEPYDFLTANVALSPDGRCIFVAGTKGNHGQVELVRCDTGETIFSKGARSYHGMQPPCFSGDSKSVAFVETDEAVRYRACVCSCTNGDVIFQGGESAINVYSASLSYDGKKLVTASMSSASVHDLLTGDVTHTIPCGHGGKFACFGHDHQSVVVSKRTGEHEVWTLDSGEYRKTQTLPAKYIDFFRHVHASPRFPWHLATDLSGRSSVWNFESGFEIANLNHSCGEVSSDGKRIGFDDDRGAFGFLELDFPKSIRQFRMPTGCQSIWQVLPNLDKSLLVASDNERRRMCVFDLKNCCEVTSASLDDSCVGSVWSQDAPNEMWWVATKSGKSQVFKANLQSLSPDNDFSRVVVSDVSEVEVDQTISTGYAKQPLLLTNDQVVFYGKEFVWCQRNSRQLKVDFKLPVPFDVGTFDVSLDSRWIAVGHHGEPEVFVVDTVQKKSVFHRTLDREQNISPSQSTSQLTFTGFSPDSSELAVATASRVEIYSTEDWTHLRTVLKPESIQGAVALSDKWLAVCLKNKIVLYDRGSLKVQAELKTASTSLEYAAKLGYNSPSMKFSRDGNFLYVGTTINHVYAWDLLSLNRELADFDLDW